MEFIIAYIGHKSALFQGEAVTQCNIPQITIIKLGWYETVCEPLIRSLLLNITINIEWKPILERDSESLSNGLPDYGIRT